MSVEVVELRQVDMLGNEYGVGDFVCYATISGKSPVLKFARVEKIAAEQRTRGRYSRDTDKWESEEYTYHKVGVREISNGRGFRRWDSMTWNAETSSYDIDLSKVRVTYPMTENIIKVAPAEGVDR